MKIALIIWNVLLTAALAYLFFTHHESGEKVISHAGISDSLKSNTAVTGSIAYVNIDSLEVNYELFSQKKKEMEGKQKQSEDLFNKKMGEFQNDYAAAQQSASTMTQSQLEETQQKLQQKQMEIQQLQDKLQTDFQKQLEAINKQLEDSLDSYVKHYNAGKQFTYIFSYTSGGTILYGEPAFDITKEVVAGMNARLKKQ